MMEEIFCAGKTVFKHKRQEPDEKQQARKDDAQHCLGSADVVHDVVQLILHHSIFFNLSMFDIE